MIPLLAAIAIGIAALVPRLRAVRASATPDQAWDHFLVSSGMRPVPVSMPDVHHVADLAGVPASLLERAALGRVDGDLALVAPLSNRRVLLAVRRTGPVATSAGVRTRDGWVLQVRPGPVEQAWEQSPVRPRRAGTAAR